MKKLIPEILKYVLIVIFIILFSYLSFARHDSLKSYMNDLGAIDQVIWNTLHGHFFQGSSVMLAERVDYNYLGAHFGFILIFITPLYWIWSSPKLLLLIQVILVALGGLPIYWLAKEKLKSQWAGLVFLFSYLLYPAIQNALLYDFHEVVLAVPFIAFALYYLEKDKKEIFIIFWILACLCQEHIALIFVLVGLYLIIFKKQRRFGLIVSVASLSWFILLLAVIMPAFTQTGQPELIKMGTDKYLPRFAWMGDSFSGIVKFILTEPGQVFAYIWQAEKIKYLFYLLMPIFGLAVLSPIVLLAVPVIFINLLSNVAMPYTLYFYHSAIITPLIYVAAIFGLKKFIVTRRYLIFFLIAILLSSLIINYIFSLTPWSYRYSLADFRQTEHAKKIEEVKKLIPEDAALSVQHNLGSHFTERRAVFRFPLGDQQADYVLMDFTDLYADNPGQIFHFDYARQIPWEIWVEVTARLLNSSEYGVIYSEDGYLLFKKGAGQELNDKAYNDLLYIFSTKGEL